jgi:hypothetical protein
MSTRKEENRLLGTWLLQLSVLAVLAALGGGCGEERCGPEVEVGGALAADAAAGGATGGAGGGPGAGGGGSGGGASAGVAGSGGHAGAPGAGGAAGGAPGAGVVTGGAAGGPARGVAFARLRVSHTADLPGTFGSGLAFDGRDGLAWMITDRFNRAKDWRLRLVRVRLTSDAAEVAEVVPLREQGVPLTGADLDPEDVAVSPDGSLWVCEESKPSLLRVSRRGEVEERVEPPPAVQDRVDDRGFEGCAVGAGGRVVYAILQSGVKSEPDRLNTLLAAYDVVEKTWALYPYRLDDPRTYDYPEDVRGTAGACALAAAGGNDLYVLERDNQAGDNARLKRIYKVSVPPSPPATPLPKTLVLDLAALGYKKEKAEGLAMIDARTLLVANDNDGDPTMPTEIWRIRM